MISKIPEKFAIELAKFQIRVLSFIPDAEVSIRIKTHIGVAIRICIVRNGRINNIQQMIDFNTIVNLQSLNSYWNSLYLSILDKLAVNIYDAAIKFEDEDNSIEHLCMKPVDIDEKSS